MTFCRDFNFAFMMVTAVTFSCKTTETMLGKPKHIFGRTSVPAPPAVATCVQTEENPDGVAYIKGLAQWIMSKNPETFKGDYAPDKFCFRVIPQQDINSSASVAIKYISVTSGLLKIDGAKDADIAAVIAHELAHITLQHTDRAPEESELPKDYDPAEGQRRIDAKKDWIAKVETARRQLVSKTLNNPKINAEIEKITTDPQILRHLAQRIEVKNQSEWNRVALELADTKKLSAYQDSEYLEAWMQLDRLTVQIRDLLDAAPLLRNYVMTGSDVCLANTDCVHRKTFRHILIYCEKTILPSIDQTLSIALNPKDDPNQYAPYLQWKEQQADEVGFELYLRAGLAFNRYTTYIEHMMKSQGTLDQCKNLIETQKVTPSRLATDVMNVHPDFCFRYNNATVAEMAAHSNEYEAFKPTAILEMIPGLEGALEKARAEAH